MGCPRLISDQSCIRHRPYSLYYLFSTPYPVLYALISCFAFMYYFLQLYYCLFFPFKCISLAIKNYTLGNRITMVFKFMVLMSKFIAHHCHWNFPECPSSLLPPVHHLSPTPHSSKFCWLIIMCVNLKPVSLVIFFSPSFCLVLILSLVSKYPKLNINECFYIFGLFLCMP